MGSGVDASAKHRLITALHCAERLGASSSRVDIATHSTSMLVSAVVHRARSERATTLLLVHPQRASKAVPANVGQLAEFVDVFSEMLPGVVVDIVVPPHAEAPASEPLPRASAAARITWRDMLLTTAVLGVCTAISALMERHLEQANLIMVYLAGVVYVALRGSRFAALTAVFGGIFLFDLIFVAPRWSLKPTEPQYFFTFGVMFAVGLLLSQLAARSRAAAATAEARAHRAQALNQLALQLARARSVEAIAAAVQHSTRVSLDTGARLLPAPLQSGATGPRDAAAAAAALALRAETGAGTGHHPLASATYLPLAAAEALLGVLEVEPLQAPHDTAEHHHLLKAIASQTAVALERTVMEQRSVQAAIEAESEKLRNTLLSGISHDFRTPLTTIVGSATSLLEQGAALDDDHRQALLHNVLGEAQRMHTLMSDLLDLTRMEEGAVRPNCEWCPAEDLIGEAIAALEARLQRHQVRTVVPAEAVVWCDARLVEQALSNLLDNAVRYTPPGCRIEVRIESRPGAWSLVVEDEGPGLPPGQEREVFKKFSRGRHEPAGSGTGLGLAICAAVAELHGGSIDAATTRGACFTMHFPQPEAGPPAVEDV